MRDTAPTRDTTTLRPSRRHAATCSVIGAAVIALAAWIVADTQGHALAVALLVAGGVVGVPFFGELLMPVAFTWFLDAEGLEARTGYRRVRVAWTDVRLARVVASAGDPALRLNLGGAATRTTRILRLPVGADVAALHSALARHLGPAAGAGAPAQGTGAPNQGAAPAASSRAQGQ